METAFERLCEALSDRYRIVRELGRGGMATVYLARDLKSDRDIALKVLSHDLSAVLGHDRFLAEINTIATLKHPNILSLLESGEANGALYYSMPVMDVESLRGKIDREGQIPLDEALSIAGDVADALEYAHAKGVVHRDIKPGNILFSEGRAVVGDFGIALAITTVGGDRITRTGLTVGTPDYMSPEQSAAERTIDGRSDQYALASTLYEMLAGEPPYTGNTAQAIIAKRMMLDVPSVRTLRDSVPPAVDYAIKRALSRSPADRFRSMSEFKSALTAPTPTGYVDSLRPVRARLTMKSWLLAGATVIAIAAGVAYNYLRPSGPASPTSVAILPFRVSGANSELAWLREGMVDLLSIRLTGEGGYAAVEPRSVLSAWRKQSTPGVTDIDSKAILAVAKSVGAGRVIDGGIVGTANRLTLTASVMSVPDGQILVRSTVDGPVDSLPALVDRLAVQLLSLQAGVDAHRLAILTSTSLPAVRAYLSGRAAFRRGKLDDAAKGFGQAIELDSSFATAGLGLIQVAYWGDAPGAERARDLAWTFRSKLSKPDQTLLQVYRVQNTTGAGGIAAWEAAVKAYPDRPDIWYGLGDYYYHWGALAGAVNPLKRAAEAFRQGWIIDSTTAVTAGETSPMFNEPLIHVVELAQMAGNALTVHQLVAGGLAADSSGTEARYLIWHRAIANGDSAEDATFWSRPGLPNNLWDRIVSFTFWSGRNFEDADRSIAFDSKSADPALFNGIRRENALHMGRPAEARKFSSASDTSAGALRSIVQSALHENADTSDALAAIKHLTRAATPPTERKARRAYYMNLCTTTEWKLYHNDVQDAEASIGTLRAAAHSLDGNVSTYLTVCAATLDAMRAQMVGAGDAARRLALADSLSQSFVFNIPSTTNLVLAHVAEALGDRPRALRAIRRRSGGFMLWPGFISTYWREEGRLAALTGDRAGAVKAYRAYLAMRTNPEPSQKSEVDKVRLELGKLAGASQAP